MNIILAQTFCDKVSDPASWFFSILGAGIGVFGGYLIAEYQYKKDCRKQKKLALENLYESLGKISKLTDQVKRQLTEDLEGEGIPSFTLDTANLLHRITHAETHITKELWVKLDGLRYQIEHVNMKISGLYSIAISFGSHKAVESPEFLSVLGHCEKMKEWIHDAVVGVEREREGL